MSIQVGFPRDDKPPIARKAPQWVLAGDVIVHVTNRRLAMRPSPHGWIQKKFTLADTVKKEE
jgi:hypothetical protein